MIQCKIFSIIFIFISIPVFAGEVYNVNWGRLDSAFSEYISNPTSHTAKKITKILPPGKNASHHVSSFNSKLAIKVLNQTGKIEELVDEGHSHAIKVAFALTAISDGEYSLWLSEIIADAIIKNPGDVLKGIDQYFINDPEPCTFILVISEKSEADDEVVYINRLKAVRSVKDKKLQNVRACLEKELDNQLKKFQ